MPLKSLKNFPSPSKILEEMQRRGLATGMKYNEYLPLVSPPIWTYEAEHFRLICEHLDAVTRGEIDRLAIFVPPRHGKSEAVTVRYPIHRMEIDKHTRALITASTDRLARRFSRKARTIADQRIGLASHQRSLDEWGTANGAELVARGVGSPPVGIGFNLILIDDPTRRREDAESEIYREKAWDWYCVMPGMQVADLQGNLVNIENLDIASTVVTSGGAEDRLAWGRKPYSGDAVRLMAFGYPAPLETTAEHQILTAEGWKLARDIKAGDYLAVPVPHGAETAIDALRSLIPAPPQSRADHDYKVKDPRISREALVDAMSRGGTYDDIGRALGFKSGAGISRYLQHYGLQRPVGARLDPAIVNDDDFWRVVGLWIAEGSLSVGRSGLRNVIRWAFGKTERHYAEFVVEVLGRHGLAPRIYEAGSCWAVHQASTQLAAFLSEFGVGAKNKRLPEWAVMLPLRQLSQLLLGLFQGDGNVAGRWRHRGIITSASLQLLANARRALLRLGIAGCISKSTPPRTQWIAGRLSKTEGNYALGFALAGLNWPGYANVPARRQRRYTYFSPDGQYLFARVRSTEGYHYDGPVYDISTPSHDFLVSGFLVHNCDDLYTRLEPKGAIILCQTRWHCDDLAARAIASEPGKWVVLRLPALAEAGDPLGRPEGAALWPERWNEEYLLRTRQVMLREEGEASWESLYQQNPTPKEGAFFKVPKFGFVKPREVPADLPRCRAWDLAATANGGDYTVGVRIEGPDDDGIYYVTDVIRGRWATDDRDREMALATKLDGMNCMVHIPQDPGQAGKSQVAALIRRLAGFAIRHARPTGPKVTRADPFATQVNNGNVRIVYGDWNAEFVEELRQFPAGKHDDQVDAAAAAFLELSTGGLEDVNDEEIYEAFTFRD